MDLGHAHRPRVSRETRLLVTTALVAVTTLWGFARVRFPDRPAPPNPVAPILTQLAARPALDAIAGEIAALLPRVEPLLVTVPGAHQPALRIGPDAAALLVDLSVPMRGELRERLIAVDPVSGLGVVRVPPADVAAPPTWTPQEMEQPRYLVASDASMAAFMLRPVFVGSLEPFTSPLWPTDIWLLPDTTDLSPGTFMFTTDARLAGLVATHGVRRAIVPAAALVVDVARLMIPRAATAGYLGIDAQALSAALARATGSASGVVVTWVDPMGPAARLVSAGDVLEAANDEPLPTPLHWQAKAARLTSGQDLVLRVRRAGAQQEITIAAAPLRAPAPVETLGLTLNARPGAGSVVARVAARSAAARAGIAAGDVITRIADVTAPLPAAVRRTFAAAEPGHPVLVALTRGATHHVVTLEK